MTTSRGALRGMPDGVREPAGDALEIGKYPVAPLVPQLVEGRREKLVVIHRDVFFPARRETPF